jgi:hypothetical protein
MLSTQAKQLMQQYKTQFMQDCAERAPKLTAFIQEILQGRHWGFSDENESFDQAVALIMEYEYQDFSVYGWLRNPNGGYLGDGIIDFPEECLPEFDADVEDEIYGLGQDENEEDEDEDEVWDAVDDFYSGLHEYFSHWFANCFRTAAQNTASTLPAYFSVHDTNSYTNLATMQEELCDDIAEKFGWTSFWQD